MAERFQAKKARVEDKIEDKMVVWASWARMRNGMAGSLRNRTFNKSTL